MNDEEQVPEDEPRVEITMHSIEFDGSEEDLKGKLADLPEEIQAQIVAQIGEVVSAEADKNLSKVNAKLDKLADDFRQVRNGELDVDGRTLSKGEVLGSFTHWLAEHSDMTRTSMAVMLAVAISRLGEYQDKVLDLELQLAGHGGS